VNGDIDKYYVFPKVAGSYRFLDLIGDGSEIKLRAAYGETGNQPLFGQKFTNLTRRSWAVSRASRCRRRGLRGVEPERLKEIEAARR
jgi:TonB-dependent starch-binding outer membrane protein SusC